jgi:hypothetical protein
MHKKNQFNSREYSKNQKGFEKIAENCELKFVF